MKTLLLLLLFCLPSSPEKHSVMTFSTVCVGLPNLPQYIGTIQLDGVLAGYCDTTRGKLEPRQEWAKTILTQHPEQYDFYYTRCLASEPNQLKALIHRLMRLFNHTGGVHVLQKMYGCEWDNETGEVNGFIKYGYDGEDFIELDPKTFTWIALTPEADTVKLSWDADGYKKEHTKITLTQTFPDRLKMYVRYGRSSLLRTVLPSVSLLQKTPSSPVSCHATGFYPNRAELFWRKDGEELHEEVDRGEILPNHDGTFQMSVDLNLSSVRPEDWRRYDCVFQLAGVKDGIVTKLDKVLVHPPKTKIMTILVIIALVVVLALTLIAGFICRRRNANDPPPSPDSNNLEQFEQLNPEPRDLNAQAADEREDRER